MNITTAILNLIESALSERRNALRKGPKLQVKQQPKGPVPNKRKK